MGARTPRPIWTNAVGLRSGLIVRARPYRTGCVFFHHIIINMDIDDDMMDVILNNQPPFTRQCSARVRLVGEVVGLSGMEYQPKGEHKKSI